MSNFINKVLKKCIEDFNNNDDNKRIIIENLLTPMMDDFMSKISPYITLIVGMYILNMLLIIAILIIILYTRNVK